MSRSQSTMSESVFGPISESMSESMFGAIAEAMPKTRSRPLKRRLRELYAQAMRVLGPRAWPYFENIPRVGKFAEAIRLHNNPFRNGVPSTGSVLNYDVQSNNSLILQPSTDAIPFYVLFGKEIDWRGRNLAIIAHWDAQETVKPYVQQYAAALKRLGYGVLLASAGIRLLPPGIENCVDSVIIRNGPGYDFTSWKAALLANPSIVNATELLLVNDSVFAPIGDLEPLHICMNAVVCDFWGVIESHAVQQHLQSYYLVFRQAALKNEGFETFWQHVGSSGGRNQAVSYEIQLTKWLLQHGLQGAARFPQICFTPSLLNPSHYAWDSLIRTGHYPFLKRELVVENPYAMDLESV